MRKKNFSQKHIHTYSIALSCLLSLIFFFLFFCYLVFDALIFRVDHYQNESKKACQNQTVNHFVEFAMPFFKMLMIRRLQRWTIDESTTATAQINHTHAQPFPLTSEWAKRQGVKEAASKTMAQSNKYTCVLWNKRIQIRRFLCVQINTENPIERRSNKIYFVFIFSLLVKCTGVCRYNNNHATSSRWMTMAYTIWCALSWQSIATQKQKILQSKSQFDYFFLSSLTINEIAAVVWVTGQKRRTATENPCRPKE